MNLQDKTILITGATGGIGCAFSQRLAEQGARLILVGRNSAKLAQESSLISATLSLPVNRQPVPVAADIATDEGLETVVQACSEQGVDVLINNAGSQLFGFYEEQSPAAIAHLVQLNLVAPMLLTSLLLPLLHSRPEAAIVNIGSTFGSIGHPAFVAYSASKFGLRGFSEALRRELSGSTVKVHYLAPRATRTALNDDQVVAMNEALGNAMDDPLLVADELVRLLGGKRGGNRFLGCPEKLFVRINSLLPGLVDRALAKQLGTIRHFAGSDSRDSNSVHNCITNPHTAHKP
ncbi:MAG: hypothetical protein VR73_06300 [Gammaproteobacteria bacterium BRH_c0]|nr:MAG: hypothetical protein VR73_06300 [Gammaproteobacteria bacterium BRH_c0]